MTTEVAPKGKIVSIGMEVVLNGGKEEMNSATIPVQWVFSDETIAKSPKYLLFFEQTEDEASRYNSGDYGRRYVCKVSEGVKFIPVFKPGYHRMVVLAFAGSDIFLKAALNSFLEKQGKFQYVRSIICSYLEDEKIPKSMGDCVVTATVVEFTVPAELFAEKPRTRFENAVWRWVNLWFDGELNDECDYRRRKIFAFMFQPVAFFVASIMYATGVFVGSLFVFFFGFRPKNIFQEVWLALKLQRPEFSLTKYDDSYRVWKKDRQGHDTKLMPVTGIELALFALFLIGLIKLDFSGGWWRFLLAGFLMICLIFFLVVIVASWLKRLPISLEKKKEREEKTRQRRLEKERLAKERYQRWLATNLSLSRKPDEVDLNNLPYPPTFGGRVIQNFRVSFWALKAKVCRPYSK